MLPLDEMRDAATAVAVAAWMPAGCRSAVVHVSRRRGTAVGDSDSDATADASCFFVGDAAESKDNYFGCFCARLQLQQQQQPQLRQSHPKRDQAAPGYKHSHGTDLCRKPPPATHPNNVLS
ncbi:GD13497 [Drosophila simulans]|uniref:GD13497 n=1 Tax=Drosophila simulans TaxID=7240 RepID=B4QLW9_DROSI|nr:GD13497 [Drosophila simulans]